MARLTPGIKAGRKAKIVAATFVATTLLVLLVANLALGDKRIDRRVPVLYSVEDAQFRRTMGVILGPQMLAGNRVEALVNGNRIFPAASYFVPDDVEVRALAEAARRGARVQIIVPGPEIDSEMVRRASRASRSASSPRT